MDTAMASSMANNPKIDPALSSGATSTGLGLNALTVAVAAYVAFCAFQFSHFSWLRSADREAAFAAQPDDAIALAQHVWATIASDPSYKPDEVDLEHARTSLIKAPLSSQPIWVIGKFAQDAGDIGHAETAMVLADRVTKRDSLSQLWLIERSIEKDDIKEAVRHYNSVLSVNAGFEATLFPILSQAISFPEVRTALAPYLVKGAHWIPAFVRFVAANSKVEDFLEFVSPLGSDLKSVEFEDANRTMIGRIAREKGGFAALDYATRAVPNFDRQAFSEPGFTKLTTDTRFGSLAWKLINADGINTQIGTDGGLIVELQPDKSGTAAFRDIPVKPGTTYLISQTLSDIGGIEGHSIKWLAQCLMAGNTGIIGEADAPWPKSSQTHEARILVPDDCGLIRISLIVLGPQSQLPANLEISHFEITAL